jgi:putative transposase
MSRAGSTTIASWSCAGCMTGAIFRRCGAISLLGSPKWSGKYPKLIGWVEKNIEETVTYFWQPLAHSKPMKPTNMLERLNEEIRRRTYGVRIFPNARSCLRLVRALCVETYEAWLEAHIYLNMQLLTEHKKETLRQAA